MTFLADVNVWLALSVIDHVHHEQALVWFHEAQDHDIVFCRVTQKGFLRLLTNPRIMGPDVFTASKAWETYDTLLRNAHIGFLPEPAGIEDHWRTQTQGPHSGPNFWTDAYLAAFAAAAELTIVTFDRALGRRKNVVVRLLSEKSD